MRTAYGVMITLLMAMVILLAGCGTDTFCNSDSAEKAVKNAAGDRESLYQVSLLQDLTQGDYYGSVPVSKLKKKGDIGLGTFNRLNGEMIVLDGRVYRADGKGKVEEAADNETTPFASVTFFDEDDKAVLKDVKNLNSLISVLDKKYTKHSKNYF